MRGQRQQWKDKGPISFSFPPIVKLLNMPCLLSKTQRINLLLTCNAVELGVIGPLRRTNHSAGIYGGEERPHCIGGKDTTATQSQLSP